MAQAKPRSRIQERNRQTILSAALDLFSQYGLRGTTLDQIADAAGLSKPNMLYYFPSKDSIYAALLARLLDDWLDPLRALDPAGQPIEEFLAYVDRKLALSRDYPRESRLFASEILQGAPHIHATLTGELRALVDEKASVIRDWAARGDIADVDPHHLIFSVWSMTQHYADFDVQVRAVLAGEDPYVRARAFLRHLYRRTLEVGGTGGA